MNTIWAFCSARANRSTESATPWAVRLFSTRISPFSPAFSTAFRESYSQLVPGNTGMSTRGTATARAGRTGGRLSALMAGIGFCPGVVAG